MNMLPWRAFSVALCFLPSQRLLFLQGFVHNRQHGMINNMTTSAINIVPRLRIKQLDSYPTAQNFSSSSSDSGGSRNRVKMSSVQGKTSKVAMLMIESTMLKESSGNYTQKRGKLINICIPFIMPQTCAIALDKAIFTPRATSVAASVAAPAAATAAAPATVGFSNY